MVTAGAMVKCLQKVYAPSLPISGRVLYNNNMESNQTPTLYQVTVTGFVASPEEMADLQSHLYTTMVTTFDRLIEHPLVEMDGEATDVSLAPVERGAV